MSLITQRTMRTAATEVKTIGVLIPTYKRTKDLLRCLESLKLQQRMPDECLLVVRTDDRQTLEALDGFDPGPLQIRRIVTDIPGTVHAHNIAIDVCRTDVLAMIDDDTEPQPQWARVILENFQRDRSLGGLGGRDRCFDGETFNDAKAETVGKLQWSGRVIGNHHLGYGGIRDVDVLKGANMSFRHEALEHARCDVRLRGRGAQPSEDVSLTLAVRRGGWKIAYDPEALVFHYQGSREEIRHYSGINKITDPKAFEDFSYNEVISIWDSLPRSTKVIFMVWSLLIGTGVCPGIVQAIRYTPTLGKESWYRFAVAMRGKSKAIVYLLRTGVMQGPSQKGSDVWRSINNDPV